MFGSNSVDKNVHPAAAALVISVVVLAIGGWLWCSHEAKRYGGPAGLAVDPSGHLYIQVQNTLLEHDVDGRFIARHDLATLGVGTLLGDVAFFSNGDVLLRRGEDTRSMLDTVRAYLRQTNRRDIASAAPDTASRDVSSAAGSARTSVRHQSTSPRPSASTSIGLRTTSTSATRPAISSASTRATGCRWRNRWPAFASRTS